MLPTKHSRVLWISVVLGALALPTAAQDPHYVAIKAGRVITVSGEEFTPGVIVIEDGKITAVGPGLEFPGAATVIDVPHQTVMPGFVNPRTRFGLDDFSRTGVHGDQSAADEIYLDRIAFDEFREAGFTTVCFVPSGRGIPGRASVYRTGGDEDSRLIADAGYLHVNADKKSVLRDALKKAKEEIEKVEKARKEWDEKQKKKLAEPEKKPSEDSKEEEGDDENGDGDPEPKPNPKPDPDGTGDDEGDDDNGDPEPAPAEGEGEKASTDVEPETFKPPVIDPKYQPLVDLIESKDGARMLVQLADASGLLHLDDVLQSYEDLNHSLYLATGRSVDYHHVLDKLKQRKARVALRPMLHYLPQTTFRYNLLRKLVDAECEVSVVPYSDAEEELERVRARLAELVRAGLKKKEAYKMLTLHPARLIGLGEKIGSIEKARDADLVFFDGEPLDPHSTVRRVMILGETVFDAEEDD